MKVLYVGHSHTDPEAFCPGSLVCMSLVERLNESVMIQNCTVLRESEVLPKWLNGTPIYIDQKEGVPYRGTDAVHELQRMIRSESSQRRGEDAKPEEAIEQRASQSASRGSAQPPPRMSPPAQTRQPRQKTGDHGTKPASAQISTGFEADHMAMNDEEEGGFDATFNGDTSTNVKIGESKLTDEDLQRFMEQRNSSPANAQPPQPPTRI